VKGETDYFFATARLATFPVLRVLLTGRKVRARLDYAVIAVFHAGIMLVTRDEQESVLIAIRK